MRTLTAPILLLAAVAVLAASCGGDKDTASLEKACPIPAPAMKQVPRLPGRFPSAQGVIYTGFKQEGPTAVASGYLRTTIGPAHDAYVQAVSGAAGYRVTKEEQEKADAEVNFSGAGNTGQVKLLQTCKARTKVTITIRPA